MKYHIYNKCTRALVLTAVSLAAVACAEEEQDSPVQQPLRASLAFSVSVNGVTTRMSDDATKGNGDIDAQHLYLYPFKGTPAAQSSEDRIVLNSLKRDAPPGYYNYYDDESAEIPEDVTHFLCYYYVPSPSGEKASKGSTVVDALPPKIQPLSISFRPEVISTSASDGATGQYLKTTAKAENDLARFVYPAQLLYYANSPIRTSYQSLKEYYQNEWSWNRVLRQYENENGKMEDGVQSVAIVEPLNYAVGCLQIGLVAGSSLSDSAGTTFTLRPSEPVFPLTAVFATGQFEQNYDFTPKDAANEYIVYDSQIAGISMDNSTGSTPGKYTSTLVLQSKVGQNVRFALEFENKSGKTVKTLNGDVPSGSRFYLVGTIRVPPKQDDYYQRQVFTKDHLTRGTVTVSSLKNAYPYLPDLFNPNLEVGLELVTEWIQSTTTNVPL